MNAVELREKYHMKPHEENGNYCKWNKKAQEK